MTLSNFLGIPGIVREYATEAIERRCQENLKLFYAANPATILIEGHPQVSLLSIIPFIFKNAYVFLLLRCSLLRQTSTARWTWLGAKSYNFHDELS